MGPAEQLAAARRDPTLVVLEGIHALKHALRFGAQVQGGWTHQAQELDSLIDHLCPELKMNIAALMEEVEAGEWERMMPTRLPSPVVSIARRPAQSMPTSGRIVVLEDPRHLGNIGAVIRVAAAAGATGVVVLGEADPWHPTSVRGAAGLQFALATLSISGISVLSDWRAERPLVALDADGEGRMGTLAADAILLFGSERRGLSRELLDLADQRIAIPMREGVSSLNLATSVAVTLYS